MQPFSLHLTMNPDIDQAPDTILAVPSPEHIDVSVVIVSYNTRNYLEKALAAIERGLKRYKVEVIVVDNASTDGSVEYLLSLGGLRCIFNSTNQGFALANNQAFKIAQGEFLFLLNSDAFLHSNCGDELVDFLLYHPKIGLVVPSFEYPNGRWQPSFGFFPDLSNNILSLFGLHNLSFGIYSWFYEHRPHSLRPKKVDYGEGAGLLVRREIIDSLGGLSPAFFFYGEDMEFAFRARQVGWESWWLPSACLTHVRGGSMTRKDFELGVETKLNSLTCFWRKHFSPTTAYLFFLLHWFYSLEMYSLVSLLSWMPFWGKRLEERKRKYGMVKDIYTVYLPPHRFSTLGYPK